MVKSHFNAGTATIPGDLSVYLQSKINMKVFRYLPPRVGRAWMGWLGRQYFALNPEHWERIRSSLDEYLQDADPSEKKVLHKRTFEGIIDHYYEKLSLACYPWPQLRQLMQKVDVTGLDILSDALSRGKGAILVTGHYGAVEYLPFVLGLQKIPITILAHCKTPALKKRLDALAEAHGGKIVDPKAGQILYTIFNDLKENRVILTQCDEMSNWRPYRNRKINFLGREMDLDRSLDILAAKSGAPVVFGLNRRISSQKYHLNFEYPGDHPVTDGLELISEQCLTLLDYYIQKHPDMWYEWTKLARPAKVTYKAQYENRKYLGLHNKLVFPTASSA